MMMVDGIEQISVQSLKDMQTAKKDFLLLDVRSEDEYELANIGGLNIPLFELGSRAEELDKSKDIVIHCHHGGRSQRAAMFLRDQGFTSVKNLTGGIDAWSINIDPAVPRY